MSHLATTFDDRFLVSGGGDGNVFVYQANLPTAEQRERIKAQRVKVHTHTHTHNPTVYAMYGIFPSIHFQTCMCVVLQIPAESGKSANDIEDPEHYR